jgi:hypothetical protein
LGRIIELIDILHQQMQTAPAELSLK